MGAGLGRGEILFRCLPTRRQAVLNPIESWMTANDALFFDKSMRLKLLEFPK